MTATHIDTPASAPAHLKSPHRWQQSPPETVSQAISWETVKNRMLRLGLCERCAAQYAWGTQIGFAKSHPPCADCMPIVTEHGKRERPNGWYTIDHRKVAPPPPHSEVLPPNPDHATGATDRPPNAIGCGGCDAYWTGLSAGHCGACHRSFTSVSAFDKHREGDHAKGTRHCVDPATIGLVPADKPWPGWSLPGTWSGPDDDDD